MQQVWDQSLRPVCLNWILSWHCFYLQAFDKYFVASTETTKAKPVSPGLENPDIKIGEIKLQNRLLIIYFYDFINAMK